MELRSISRHSRNVFALLRTAGEKARQDRSTDQSNGWLTDLLIYWLIHWPFTLLTDWLADWLVGWLTDWLTDVLTDGFIDWLTDLLWLNHWMTYHKRHHPDGLVLQGVDNFTWYIRGIWRPDDWLLVHLQSSKCAPVSNLRRKRFFRTFFKCFLLCCFP